MWKNKKNLTAVPVSSHTGKRGESSSVTTIINQHHHITFVPTPVFSLLEMDLQPLLVALMSDNNDIRQQAEKSLNDEWLENAPDSLLLQLAKQTRVADTETVRCPCMEGVLTCRFDLLHLCC